MASPVSSSSAAMAGTLQHSPLSSPSSSLFGGSGSSTPLKKTGVANNATPSISHTSSNKCYNGQVLVPGRNLVVRATTSDDETKQTSNDRWAGLAYDISDDQQDITRGKGMVDSLFQGAVGVGTQHAVMSSYEYLSQGQRFLNMDNIKDGYYIAPAFMDKLVVHIAKNFMNLPNIKVPLILGIWGGKGQGKSYQCELVFSKLGINPIAMSAGELESGNAGEPAKLIRQRYREAADIIRKKGKMCCLFINDLDAGAGRMGGTTQYTVNNQMVNATLMNIADNPTNVQLPGVYNKEEIPRVPIIVTGNDFSTLYAPLIRDGRMEKFYWAPTREDRIGVCSGIFRVDDVNEKEIAKLVDAFPGQSIDFFGAIRARVYDDEVRKWVVEVGVESMGKLLVNSKTGPPTFKKPNMSLDKLLEYGQMLVQEQDNVKRVKLADKYLKEAALGDANEDSIKQGTFYGAKQASIEQKESSNESKLEEEKIKEEITSAINEKEEEKEEEKPKEEEEEEKPIIANENVEEEETKEEEKKPDEEEPITESLNVIDSTVNVVDDVKIESIATTEEVVEDDNKTSVNVVNTQVEVVEEESVTITAESVDTIEPAVNVVVEEKTVESVNVVETITKDENSTTITESVKVVVNAVEKENESTTTTKVVDEVEPLVKDEKKVQNANVAEKKTNEEAGRELSRQSVTGALRGLLSKVLSILKR